MKTIYDEKFVQAYKVLRTLPLTLTEICFIELVISYQRNDQEFYMSQKDIASYLKLKGDSSVRNLTNKLQKEGYITKKQTFNGTIENDEFIGRGSNSVVTVNLDFLNNKLYRVEESIQPEAPVSLQVYNTKPIITPQQLEVISQPSKSFLPDWLEEDEETEEQIDAKVQSLHEFLGPANKPDEFEGIDEPITSIDELKLRVRKIDQTGRLLAIDRFFKECDNWELDYAIGFAENLIFN